MCKELRLNHYDKTLEGVKHPPVKNPPINVSNGNIAPPRSNSAQKRAPKPQFQAETTYHDLPLTGREKCQRRDLNHTLSIQPGRWCHKPLNHKSSALANQYPIESRVNQT